MPKRSRQTECLLNVQELAFLAGTSRRIIERMVWFEVIEPARSEPEPGFPPQAVARVRRVLRIRDELGVSWSSMGLVLELMERVAQLEAELRSRQER
ncbi:MAG: hypothetical protein JXR37_05065 [Kiritimatiellae bacterium]|nr:hypothetical protein [Kiritimatiellia bacterium]